MSDEFNEIPEEELYINPIDERTSDYSNDISKAVTSKAMLDQPFWKFSTIVLIIGFVLLTIILRDINNSRLNDLKEQRDDALLQADKYETKYEKCLESYRRREYDFRNKTQDKTEELLKYDDDGL